MGKKTKSRESSRRAAEQALAARLRAHSKVNCGPAFIDSYGEFAGLYRAKIETYRDFALRAPEQWRCRLRTRSPEKRFLDLVRFAFARYPVARHLEDVWIDDAHAFGDQVGVPAGGDGDRYGGPDFRRWYILAAQGASLYRNEAHPYLSKLETHHFLNAPEDVGSTQRAFWYAVARAQTPDVCVAVKVARTKLAAFPVALAYWKEVARYFARHPSSILEMNDLIDFLEAAKAEDENFSLRGRSLAALRRRMEEWHRALRKRDVVCGGIWEGHPLPDVAYEAGDEHRRAIWRLKQIKTGNDLFREGERMHHCVSTYKYGCVSGAISIWSLTCEYPIGKLNRGVTIELRNDGEIVQCRGFANRLPYANEVSVVKRWASEYGLMWHAVERS